MARPDWGQVVININKLKQPRSIQNWTKLIKKAKVIKSFDLSNMDIGTIKKKVGAKRSHKKSNGIFNWTRLIKRAKQIRSFDLSNLDINLIKQKMGTGQSRGIQNWMKLIKKAK